MQSLGAHIPHPPLESYHPQQTSRCMRTHKEEELTAVWFKQGFIQNKNDKPLRPICDASIAFLLRKRHTKSGRIYFLAEQLKQHFNLKRLKKIKRTNKQKPLRLR